MTAQAILDMAGTNILLSPFGKNNFYVNSPSSSLHTRRNCRHHLNFERDAHDAPPSIELIGSTCLFIGNLFSFASIILKNFAELSHFSIQYIKIHSMNSTLYAFTLGREWKISLAELLSFFREDSLISYGESFAIFSLDSTTDADILGIFGKLGGSIRVIKILSSTTSERFATDILKELETNSHDGKITFALGSYGRETPPLADIGMRMKKTLANNGIKSRLVNSENKNINSAAFK